MKEYQRTLVGAFLLLGAVAFFMGPVAYFATKADKPQFTEPAVQAPDAFIAIREQETGRIVQRIHADSTIHPDWRRKFHLLEQKMRRICACGCCTGDVREGRY